MDGSVSMTSSVDKPHKNGFFLGILSIKDGMEQRIEEVFRNINNNILNGVSPSLEGGIQVCINYNSGHFEYSL